MSIATESERLLELHCQSKGVKFGKLSEQQTKTPDYWLQLPSRPVVAEVKQLDPNQADQLKSTLDSCVDDGVGLAPVKRVRQKLAEAYDQIRGHAKRGVGAIVVVHNNAGLMNYIDNFTVTKAMFGSPQIYLRPDKNGILRLAGQGFGSGQKLTRNSCRGISAVCVLETSGVHQTHISAYHNPYASNPIGPAELSEFADIQYMYDLPSSAPLFTIFPRPLEV